MDIANSGGSLVEDGEGKYIILFVRSEVAAEIIQIPWAVVRNRTRVFLKSFTIGANRFHIINKPYESLYTWIYPIAMRLFYTLQMLF